jgi:hypothetical protein
MEKSSAGKKCNAPVVYFLGTLNAKLAHFVSILSDVHNKVTRSPGNE